MYAGWPKASWFQHGRRRTVGTHSLEQDLPVPAARAVVAVDHAQRPEARIAGGEQAFKDINCLAYARRGTARITAPAS